MKLPYVRSAVIFTLFATLFAVLPVAAAEAKRKTFGSRTLKQPMRGTDVRVLQDYLTKAGFRTTVDGAFGAGTKRNVIAWERSKSMRANGIVSTRDAKILRDQAANAAATADPNAVERPDEDVDNGGAAWQDQPTVTAGERATVGRDGLAIAPASAPPEVKAVIAHGNKIAKKPYFYGGGHGRWEDPRGYDCSGSTSYALHFAGLQEASMPSGSYSGWGQAGKGEWITIYYNGGHVYMVVAGLRFDTSGLDQDGSRWHKTSRSSSGFAARHPKGL